MNSNDDFNAISQLDLEPIKLKLMHKPSGEGWSAAKADAVEVEYRRFLHLMKTFPDEETAPLADVDTFWHYHILDTLKYAADCNQAFGYFLHHYPYVGILGDAAESTRDAGATRMQQLYETTFGDSYDRAAWNIAAAGTDRHTIQTGKAAYCAAGSRQAAYCAAVSTKAAYCAAGSKEAAYCAAGSKEAAYCAAGSKKAAYCAAGSRQAAYCAAGSKEAAYCAAGSKDVAYCAAGSKEAAYCAVGTRKAASGAAQIEMGRSQRNAALMAAS